MKNNIYPADLFLFVSLICIFYQINYSHTAFGPGVTFKHVG